MKDLKQTHAIDQFSLMEENGLWTLRRLGCGKAVRRFSGTKTEAIRDSVGHVLKQCGSLRLRRPDSGSEDRITLPPED